MRNKLDFTKRALVLGGLLIGTATVALAPSAANARNFIGVEVGPRSGGIGAKEPDYYYAPAQTYAPAPQTYVAPPAAYSPPPPVSYQAPVTTYQAPVTTYQAPARSTSTTTTTYYSYPSETTTYYSYRPGLVPRATETATTYYGQ